MLKRLRIWFLKRQLMKVYLRGSSMLGSATCGHELLKEISNSYWLTCMQANTLMDKLSELGEQVPPERL